MAEIAGFKGLLFDPKEVTMSGVLAPPYDVIDAEGRSKLIARDPHNCVQVILPECEGDANAKYGHARDLLTQWTKEGTLLRDEEPAVYRYHQVFSRSELGDAPVTRRGFIAAVKLHDFEEHVILRHERTLKGPKVDRLKLWEETATHLSQIFTLYSDPDSVVDDLFLGAEAGTPCIDGTTEDGTRHILWRVNEPSVVAAVTRAMESKHLYIADGHHRYETMLALRDKLLAKNPDADARSAARYGMMFLANIDDPGLVVLPTHRLVYGLADFDATALHSKLERCFILREVQGAGTDAELLRHELALAAEQGSSFALIIPGQTQATIATLKSKAALAELGVGTEQLDLDVSVLHKLVLEGILGIDREAQEAQTSIRYIKDTEQALARCAAAEGQACFLMNATPVSQIVAVSDADQVMPQKSTFFYPKIASGMVFNPLHVDETL